jgi:cell division protein FtsL
MSRLNVILLIALLVSSVYLVRVSYDSRRLFADLDRAQDQERTLEHDKERLQTELRTQATPLRVEKTARDRLAMRAATPAVTQYVTVAPAASSAVGAGAGAAVVPVSSGPGAGR